MTADVVSSKPVEISGRLKQAAGRSGYLTGLGILITLGSLAAALWGIDIPDTTAALNRMDLRYVLLALLSVVLTSAAKAARWRSLFDIGNTPSFRRAFAVLNISLLLNTFAPARLGDLARVLLLGRAEEASKSKSFILGTIVVEKASDLFGLVLGTMLLLFFLPLPGWFTGAARGMFITALLLMGILIILAWQASFLAHYIQKLERHPLFRWLAQDTSRALQRFNASERPVKTLGFVLWTLGMPVLGTATNLLVFKALGLHLSFWAALFLLIVLMLGISAPSTPGRFGLFHYLTILALTQFGVDKAAGLACGIVLHLIVLLPTVLLGSVFLWRERSFFPPMAASLNGLKAYLLNKTGSK